MVEAYEEQAAALIEGGVDILLIETAQDLLQAKIATIGVLEAMRKAGKRLPVTVQVTLQESGAMLLGTEIGAALTALEPYDIDVIGLNCATGPAEMNEAVRYLALNSTKEVSVLPNAGLPQNEGGHAVYKLSPEELAKFHKHFVVDYGVRIVGGCCGTKPRAPEGRSRRRLRRRAREERSEARGRSFERLHVRSSRSRAEAPDRRRRDEHHDARRALPQPGAREKVRRHSDPGEKASERRLAHARPLLRHRRRRREGLHLRDPRKNRHPRARARSWSTPPKPTSSKRR